jgi:hypothetical protein
MRRWVPWCVVLIVVAGAAAAFAATRGPDQPEVSVDALPEVTTANQAAVYVDCSKINGLAYFSDNPCQTFLLLQSSHFSSAAAFWDAEQRQMRRSGWRHSAAQLVDYDGAHGGMAGDSESWVSPAHDVCAYVTTRQHGVAAETRELFPYDPYDVPHGVYGFYRTARATTSGEALWVRLRPPNRGGHCIG